MSTATSSKEGSEFLQTWQSYYTWTRDTEGTQGSGNDDSVAWTAYNRHLYREIDVMRAAVCTLAVNMTHLDDVKQVFSKSGRLEFLKVVISPFEEQDSQVRARILIAVAARGSHDYTGKTVFVAFQGIQCTGDEFDNVKIPFREFVQGYGLEAKDTMSGWFHGRLYKVILNQLPSVKQIMDYCQELVGAYDLQKGFRVVFCGHGIGGAISHLELLCHLLCHSQQTLQKCPVGSLVSIAFGAPPICNSKAREYLRHIFPVEDRFLNFINEGDSVAVLLHNLEVVRSDARLSATSQLMTKIQRLSIVLSPFGVKMESASFRELTESMMEIGSYFPRLFFPLEAVQGPESEQRFAPFGKYWRLERQTDDAGWGWRAEAVHQPDITQIAVCIRPECFQAHSMTSYLAALFPESSSCHVSRYGEVLVETGKAPQVTSAVLSFVQRENTVLAQSPNSKFARITVKGSHLSLLLIRKCEVSILRQRWEVLLAECDAETVTFQTTSAVQPQLCEELTTNTEDSKIFVQITTAYGSAGDFFPSIPVHLSDASTAISTLNIGLVKLLFLSEALRKMSLNEIHKQPIKQLKLNFHLLLDALSAVADLAGMKLEFEDIVLGFDKPNVCLLRKKRVSDSFVGKATETLCSDVTNLLSGCDTSVPEDTVLKMIFAVRHVGKDKYQMEQIVHHLAHYFCPWLQSVSGICPLQDSTAWLKERVRLDTYDKLLTFLYNQLVEVYSGEANIVAIMQDVLDYFRSQLDQDYYPKKDRIRMIEEMIALRTNETWSDLKDVKLALGCFTTEVEERLSQRLKLFHSLMLLRKPVMAQTVVAVVGVGNCGKSTLVNMLTSSPKEAETGHMVHTEEIGVYTMKDSEALVVDVPGSYPLRSRAGALKRFGRFADLYIMMTRFTGDITQEDKSNIQALFDMVGDEARVVLLVNQVDGVLKGEQTGDDRVWKEFTPRRMLLLKQRYSHVASVSENRSSRFSAVHFTVTASNSISSLELKNMKLRSVLVGDDVVEAIRKLIVGFAPQQGASSLQGGRT